MMKELIFGKNIFFCTYYVIEWCKGGIPLYFSCFLRSFLVKEVTVVIGKKLIKL